MRYAVKSDDQIVIHDTRPSIRPLSQELIELDKDQDIDCGKLKGNLIEFDFVRKFFGGSWKDSEKRTSITIHLRNFKVIEVHE